MNSLDAIVIDLRGKVMTCQNTGAKGVHKIVHVAEFEVIASTLRCILSLERSNCPALCPVVQLCEGSCMFLEWEFFKQSYANMWPSRWRSSKWLSGI